MFDKGEIWAYPTDTSFGLGARCDDPRSLERLFELKKRRPDKPFSLMVKDEAMLAEYSELPIILSSSNLIRGSSDHAGLDCPIKSDNDNMSWQQWFSQKPRTALLAPSEKLPKSAFWPQDKVAFRIATLDHIKHQIEVPVTATSANIGGQDPIFSVNDIGLVFGDEVLIDKTFETLPEKDPSEIWDFTGPEPIRIR